MLTDPVTFRRTAAGLLLIVAPLLQAIAVFIDPGTWGDEREAVSFGDNPVLAQLQSVLYHWSWIFMALAALGLVHLTRHRATVFGHIAGAVTVVGYISASALLMGDPIEWWLGQRYAPEEAQRITEEMLGLPGVIWGFQMPWMFFAILGLPLLVVAVWRAGFVSWWVPALVAAGCLLTLPFPYGPITAILWVMAVVGLGWTGLKILRMGDEAWAAYYAAPATARVNA
ncbi:hypothetical protein [Nonomuraea sp. NPDC048826]|uniref:hypothetical protein n=1 Tax=Nonomuraea sp. NPDC048826 TaxID=3364347 RepID=UPI00371DB930